MNINEDGITQVLLNLFYNAIGAMDTEGVLTIQTEYLTQPGVVQVRIQDDGPESRPKMCLCYLIHFIRRNRKVPVLGFTLAKNYRRTPR